MNDRMPQVMQVMESDPDLKAYIGTKILLAKAMSEEEWLISKGINIQNRETQGDGYLVVYDDGYRSWSPKNVFEIHYRLITNNEQLVAKH